MQYYLVHIEGRMGFEYAANAGHAMRTAAREMGYSRSAIRDLEELKAQSLDDVRLEDVQDIISMGGFVPAEVRAHFGITEEER